MLQVPERVYYRDKLRAARYAALEDAEAFHQICFVLEEFGSRLLRRVADIGGYEDAFRTWLDACGALETERDGEHFSALYGLVRGGRNDAMHTGTYARHVTAKAVGLCMLLEDALMSGQTSIRRIGDHMVKEPVSVEPWQTVRRARQLILMHSFSNLPIRLDGSWHLLTEHGLARSLTTAGSELKLFLARPIQDVTEKLGLIVAPIVHEDDDMFTLLGDKEWQSPGSPLWLITGQDNANLQGVISVSELL